MRFLAPLLLGLVFLGLGLGSQACAGPLGDTYSGFPSQLVGRWRDAGTNFDPLSVLNLELGADGTAWVSYTKNGSTTESNACTLRVVGSSFTLEGSFFSGASKVPFSVQGSYILVAGDLYLSVPPPRPFGPIPEALETGL